MIRLESKRHDVYLIEDQIHKYYKDVFSFNREREILEKVLYPKIISIEEDKQLIVMSYIKGETLLNVLEKHEASFEVDDFVTICLMVFDKLKDFHLLFDQSMKFNDLNFKNIIYNEQVYLIDFETVEAGDVNEDYLAFVAMLVMYNPINSEFKCQVKKILLDCLCKRLGLELNVIKAMYDDEVKKISKRRR